MPTACLPSENQSFAGALVLDSHGGARGGRVHVGSPHAPTHPCFVVRRFRGSCALQQAGPRCSDWFVLFYETDTAGAST